MKSFLERIRTETWAKHARVEKQPDRILGRKIVPGLYFVKDSITILGTGTTADIACRDAWNGLQGPQYKSQDSTGASL